MSDKQKHIIRAVAIVLGLVTLYFLLFKYKPATIAPVVPATASSEQGLGGVGALDFPPQSGMNMYNIAPYNPIASGSIFGPGAWDAAAGTIAGAGCCDDCGPRVGGQRLNVADYMRLI